MDAIHAFDNVWHQDLLYNLKQSFAHTAYQILESYLQDIYYMVSYGQEIAKFFPVPPGVQQENMLVPLLYLIFMSDLRIHVTVTTASFVEDKAIMVNHTDPNKIITRIQQHFYKIHDWARTWTLKM